VPWEGRRPGRAKRSRPGSRSEEEALEAALRGALPHEGSELLRQVRCAVGAASALGAQRARGVVEAAWGALLRAVAAAPLPGPRRTAASAVASARSSAGLEPMPAPVAAALARGAGGAALLRDPVEELLAPFTRQPPRLLVG
jgi:hypothetical protein